jgi:hypothetical protein
MGSERPPRQALSKRGPYRKRVATRSGLKSRYMLAHRLQEVVHFGQQSERIIYWRCDFSEAFNECFLPGDAGFLLRYVPDAHLQFCLTCPHGVSP